MASCWDWPAAGAAGRLDGCCSGIADLLSTHEGVAVARPPAEAVQREGTIPRVPGRRALPPGAFSSAGTEARLALEAGRGPGRGGPPPRGFLPPRHRSAPCT